MLNEFPAAPLNRSLRFLEIPKRWSRQLSVQANIHGLNLQARDRKLNYEYYVWFVPILSRADFDAFQHVQPFPLYD